MLYWIVYCLILILGTGSLVRLMLRWHRLKSVSPQWVNLLLTILTLFLTLMAVEFYFKAFFAETNDIDTLARRNWRDRYYSGTFNSLDYRDKEWTDSLVADKIKVMVVGDSFVEGVGIKNPSDRFPDLLGQKLGSNYVVFNLGRRGAGTTQEINAITKYTYKPNILILTYFINDIDDVAMYRNIVRPLKAPEVPILLTPLVNYSYSFNFAYWRVMRYLEEGDSQWAWRLQAYNDPNAWWLHQEELISIYNGAQSEHIPLVVVVFPSLTQVAASRPITQRVVELYRQRHVPVLDVGDLVQDMPPDQLVVNSMDAHPNERVHGLVAAALYDLMVKANVVK